MPKRNAPKKERGVFEHPKGSDVWWIQYFWNGRHRERVGRRSDAITLYKKRQIEKLQGDKLPELQRKRVTVDELVDDVLAFTAGHKSAKDYTQKGELIRAKFGDRPAEKLTASEIRQWIEQRNKKGIAPATFNRYRAFFSLMYKEAILAKKVRENPAKHIRQKREPKGRLRFLDRDQEYSKLLAKVTEAQGEERAQAFVFSCFTGARLGEQFRLQWQHVFLDRSEITFVETKSGKSRTVKINSIVRNLLAEIRPEKPGRMRVFGSLRKFCSKDPTLSTAADGKSGESPKWFAELALECGIEDYTWHNNRHTFCSWLAIAGVPLKTIQELAGHESMQTTLRYAHLSPDHKQLEVEKLVGHKPKVVQFPDRTGTES